MCHFRIQDFLSNRVLEIFNFKVRQYLINSNVYSAQEDTKSDFIDFNSR